jgi:hypothetical protein
MGTCTITLTDDGNGSVLVDYTFGDAVDEKSLAHGMGITLLKSVLASAKNFTTIEDTAPEVDVEPNRVVVPDGGEK